MAETPPPDAPPPALRDLSPRVVAQPQAQGPLVPAAGKSLSVRGTIERLELPLDAVTPQAWNMVRTEALPPALVAAWAINGLRVGILPQEQMQAFVNALGPAMGVQDSKIVGMQELAPVNTTPMLTRPGRLQWQPHEQVREHLDLTAGQFRFLIRASRSDAGQATLEMTPQFYRPQASVIPKTPAQRLLEGRIFSELTISAVLEAGQWLVVAYDPLALDPLRPAEPAETPSPQAADPSAATQPAAALSPAQLLAAMPPNLGRFLLLSQRMNQPLQMVLLIWVSGESR